MVIEKFPELKKTESWKDYYLVINPEADPSKIYPMMTVLGRYVRDILNTQLNIEKIDKIKNIFSLIEFFMIEGNDGVKGAAASCFLENLINYTSWGSLKPETFLCYLGKESKKYCKAWDEFTGVKTEGLWD